MVSLRSCVCAVMFLGSVGVGGCAASDSGNVLSPSAVPNGALAARPTTPYDATGSWRHVVTGPDGNVVDGPVDVAVTQAADGTLTHCGECEGEAWTFTRLGPGLGPNISYRVSLTVPGTCVDVSGSARLNTRTNTITGILTGGILNPDTCSIESGRATVTLTRN